MMTPTMLERASAAFRKGYRDCHDNKSCAAPAPLNTFAGHDYLEGYHAALAEKRALAKH